MNSENCGYCGEPEYEMACNACFDSYLRKLIARADKWAEMELAELNELETKNESN